MCQIVLQDAMDVLSGLSAQEFQQTMAMLSQNPQMAQMLMAAQQGKLPSNNPGDANKKPSLTKSKTLKAFETAQTMQMEQIKKQAEMQRTAAQGGAIDEMEAMIDIFVEQAKVDDALFIKEGVTNDELEESIMGFMQGGDQEVSRAMQQFMMKMQ